MIIFNLSVSGTEQIDAIINSILKNKFALHVVAGNTVNSYHLNSFCIKVPVLTYPIQFVTKSLLFSEIETTLRNDFPGINFHMYATPVVHIAGHSYDEIKTKVTGLNLIEEK